MRRFLVQRSGEGEAVGEGVKFSDGRCVVRWRAQHSPTFLYDSLRDLYDDHGNTVALEWLDGGYGPEES